MKFGLMVFIFFISSVALILIAVEQNYEHIYSKQIKEMKLSQIQASSQKTYSRTRKCYVPRRSFSLAKKEIVSLLLKEPIDFEVNDSSFLKKSILNKLVKVINHVNEDVVLSILAHTDAEGTAKHNLLLSQERADKLKAYFSKKTNLPLVVAIGYGETFSLENRLIEINLKRIQK